MSLADLGAGSGGCAGPRAGDFSGDSGPFVAVYDGLRREALRLLRKTAWDERSLGPSDLVGEAAVRLLKDARARSHPDPRFVFAATVRAMKRVLADRYRARTRLKRGGACRRVPLGEVAAYFAAQGVDALEVQEAVGRLAAWAPRQAEAVTCCYFLGMTVPEVAGELGVCASTVELDLKTARAWLRRELTRGGGAD